MMTEIDLKQPLVDHLFPYYFAVDGELRIVRYGPALPKVCRNVDVGLQLRDVVAIFRPQIAMKLDQLVAASNMTFFLDSLSTPVRLRGEVLHLKDRNLILFLGTPWFTDVTDLKTAGLELSDFTVHDPLVDFLYMVQAKTVAAEDIRRFSEAVKRQRDELEVKNRELERASAVKSQFLANTSHELRTPMNGILGMTSLLARTDLNPRQRNFVDKILKSGEMLLAVINDILDFSKLEATKLRLRLAKFDLVHLVHEVADMFAAAAHLKGLELVCHVGRDVPGQVEGDPARLRQVLSNLIGNAVKFTETGEIVVKVSLSAPAEDGCVLRFGVKDTGIGVPPENHARLFMPFSQVDSSMTRRHTGTGLGLAIAKQIVTMMQGEVGVISEGTSGSEFWFTTKVKAVAPAPVNGHAPESDWLRTCRVLVVDDNATNREYLKELLTPLCAQVATVNGAVEAMDDLRAAIAAKKPFDVVLLDMHMPYLSGLDLAIVLAADPSFYSLRKVLLTSVDLDEQLSQVQQAQIDTCLTKPVRPGLLLSCLKSVLSRPAHAPLEVVVPSGPASRAPVPAAPLASRRVLVVDDNPVNQEVAVAMLETLGYSAEVADDGSAAVEAVRGHRYGLVLMDLQMPVMDGYTATRRIRALEGEAARTPIVAMTAHAAETDRAQALEAGMDDYLSKPVPMEALEEVIRRAIGARAPAAPSVDQASLDQLKSIHHEEGSDLAQRLIKTFLGDLPSRAQVVREALASSDYGRVGQTAHAVRSSAKLLGASALSDLCGEMEELCRSGRFEPVRDLAMRFDAECNRVQTELRSRIAPA